MMHINQYVSVTIWKWSEPLDWVKMQEEQAVYMEDAPKGTTVRWFQIDEKTHGSVLTFASKEVYDNMKAEVDEHRSTQTACELIHVHEGVVKAESWAQACDHGH